MSFQQLKQKYNLPGQNSYKYLHPRHFLGKNNILDNLQVPPTDFELFFTSIIKREITGKCTSHIYKILQKAGTEDAQHIQGNWNWK